MADWKHAVAEDMGGHHEGAKPAKKIKRIEHEHSTNGDHIFTHHHTHPEHHPSETHTKRGDDEMVHHMLKHAGTPNEGEAESEPNAAAAMSDPANAAAAGAPPAAAAPAGAPAPAAMPAAGGM
jgi:surfactin synthase thioesterase subunit